MILSAVLFVGVPSLSATPGQRTEKLRGTIVAYERELAHACFDSICGSSVIVRLDKPRQTPTYIVVEFAYPDETSPYEYFDAHNRWQFTVVRSREDEIPLKQFFDFEIEGTKEKSESSIPIWVLVRGAEKEKLPYGSVLSYYHLAKNLTKNIWKRV